MNTATAYTDRMQNFLSTWQQEHAETFDIIRSTIINIEDSFQSESPMTGKVSLDAFGAVKLNDAPINSIAEPIKIPSASTSNTSSDISSRSHLTTNERKPELLAETTKVNISANSQLKTSELNLIGEKSNESDYVEKIYNLPILQKYSTNFSSMEPRFKEVYKGIVTLGEIRRTETELELNIQPSVPKRHSPMLQPKASEKTDVFSASLYLGVNTADTESNGGFKLSFSSNREKNSSFELFDIELESGLFSQEFIQNVFIIENLSQSLREMYEKIIEYIFCTKNSDESYSKSYPRFEIIYSIQVDSRKFFELLGKAIAELKTENFIVKKDLTDDDKKDINDHIIFLQAKLEKFIRQIGCTMENFISYKGKLKIDEIELKRLYERAHTLYDNYSLKEKTKRCLRDFYAFCQRQIILFPTYHPVNDKAPKNTAISIEYVTVRKLLEKLTECNKTILAETLMETVIFTYDHFISAHNLLLFLIKKYYTPRPIMMTFSEYSKFKDEQSNTTKLRILDIIKFWTEERRGDFERDPELLTLLITFIESIHKIVKESTSKTEFKNTWEKVNAIINSILYKKKEENWSKKVEEQFPTQNRVRNGSETSQIQNHGNMSPISTPRMRAKTFKASKFHSTNDLVKKFSMTSDECLIMLWEPREVAKQLTLIDHKMFCKIDVFEMLLKRWKRPEFIDQSPNSISFIKRFNSISFWVQYLILNQTSEDERCHLIQKFLAIAAYCLEFRNYNSAHSIYCALVRLHDKNIWSGILSTDQNFAMLKEAFNRENLTKDMDKVYSSLELPAVPSIPYFTTAFFKLQDNINLFNKFEGPEKYLKNFMLYKISECCKLMRKFQKVHFQIKKNETIYNYMKQGYKMKSNIDFENDDAEEALRNKVAEVKKTLELAAFL